MRFRQVIWPAALILVASCHNAGGVPNISAAGADTIGIDTRSSSKSVTASLHTPGSCDEAIGRVRSYMKDELSSYYDERDLQEVGEGRYYDFWNKTWIILTEGSAGCAILVEPLNDLPYAFRENVAEEFGVAPRAVTLEPANGLSVFSATFACALSACLEELSRPNGDLSLRPYQTARGLYLIVPGRTILATVDHSPTAGTARISLHSRDPESARNIISWTNARLRRPMMLSVVTQTRQIEEDVEQKAYAEVRERVAALHAKGIFPYIDINRVILQRMRSPETVRRLDKSRGKLAILFRVDRSYETVTCKGYFLAGYDRDSGKFTNKTLIAIVVNRNVQRKPDPQAVNQIIVDYPELGPGTYLFSLLAQETSTAAPVDLDKKMFGFDGRLFHEI